MQVNVEFQEPDRKKKIKRTIAREGLIFISIIVVGLFLAFNPPFSNTGHIIFFTGYPIYLLTRFILWAIKTLMER